MGKVNNTKNAAFTNHRKYLIAFLREPFFFSNPFTDDFNSEKNPRFLKDSRLFPEKKCECASKIPFAIYSQMFREERHT